MKGKHEESDTIREADEMLSIEAEDILSLSSFDTDASDTDVSESMADSSSFEAVSLGDDPDDAIEKVLDAGVLAYTKRDSLHILSDAVNIENIHGVDDSNVLKAHHAFIMAKLAYLVLYLDFERFIIKSGVPLSDISEEAEGHLDHYKRNDKVGFENNLSCILTDKVYPHSVKVLGGQPGFFSTRAPASVVRAEEKNDVWLPKK